MMAIHIIRRGRSEGCARTGNETDECIVRTKGTQDFISQRLREREGIITGMMIALCCFCMVYNSGLP